MRSMRVRDREAAARELLTTLQLHGKRVAARLAEVFEPLLEEGETLPDYVLLQQTMARTVRACLSDLLAAEEAHRAIVEQLAGGDGEQAEFFLRARRSKTEAELEAAMAAFDESYTGCGGMLETLYGLAGEEEIAERLRPRPLAGEAAPPEAVPVEAEIPESPDEGDDEDQVQRRILCRRAGRPGLARWMGVRIFRGRRR